MSEQPVATTVDSCARRSAVARAGWTVAGFASVGVGAIGVIVPGLPTTVFFIAAAWCFGRSSPRFEAWVLGLPKIGPLVRDHRAGLGMPAATKRRVLAIMWVAVGISGWLVRDRPWLTAAILALGVVGSLVIVRRVPTREHVLAARGSAA